jgi:uncharacterized protein YndB with AHSA1/START domain
MSVKKDASGRRYVQAEVEVPGTPEEVWQAIATGPGISSWFVPTDIDEHKDGGIVSHFGPGMDSIATATAWDPPHRFTAVSQDLGPSAPALATEWIVEAQAGGTCVVRVVHSLFASTDDWDNQLEDIESGWPTFFRILRLYLGHFRGQPCSTIQLLGSASEARLEAWRALTGSLGLAGTAPGQHWNTPAGVPPLSGVIEQIGEGKSHSFALMRLDEPAAGTVSLILNSVGAQVIVQMSFYLYGDRAAMAAAGNEPLWRAWITEHYPFSPVVC